VALFTGILEKIIGFVYKFEFLARDNARGGWPGPINLDHAKVGL
jgi:hypothetical protein